MKAGTPKYLRGSASRAWLFPPPAAPPNRTSLSDAARNSVCGPGFGEKMTSRSLNCCSIALKSNCSETDLSASFVPSSLANFFSVIFRTRLASRFLRFTAASFFSSHVLGLFFWTFFFSSFSFLELGRLNSQIFLMP